MKMRKTLTVSFGFDRFSGLYLWVIFILIFGIWTPHTFLTMSTVKSVATQQAIPVMIALAILVPLSAGAYDLSVGATANLSTVIVVILQVNHGWNMWPAMIVAVVAGATVGAVNGFIVVKLRVSSFIATLGVATVVDAVEQIVTHATQPGAPVNSAWGNLTQHTVFGFQVVFLYMIVIAAILWWVLQCTPMGRYMYAIGGNSEAARLAGVRVGAWTWVAFVISGTICGLAGVLYASLSGPALAYGQSLLLSGFAAVFLGSTQLKPGRFNVWGCLIAVYVLATGVKGMQLITGVQWLNEMFNGVALIGAVAFAVWRQRASVGRRGQLPARKPSPSDRQTSEADTGEGSEQVALAR